MNELPFIILENKNHDFVKRFLTIDKYWLYEKIMNEHSVILTL